MHACAHARLINQRNDAMTHDAWSTNATTPWHLRSCNTISFRFMTTQRILNIMHYKSNVHLTHIGIATNNIVQSYDISNLAIRFMPRVHFTIWLAPGWLWLAVQTIGENYPRSMNSYHFRWNPDQQVLIALAGFGWLWLPLDGSGWLWLVLASSD